MFVTVDVAHGHHNKVIDMVKRLKDDGATVIAGNVATYSGSWALANAGADAVKVGIGPGSVCTTREVTGVGVPQLSAIMDVYKAFCESPNPPLLIADGGIKNSGDIVKALAAGADAVMIGSLLAGTTEAPGEVRVGPDNRRWRPYRGQSIFGVNGEKFTPEGISGWVEEKGPVANVLKKLEGGIRSGMSYTGARNLMELRLYTDFIKVSHATHYESRTRIETEIG
jgi:IMP dehydrogenase